MKPLFIIMHHSETDDGKTLDKDNFKRYHMAKGWRDIGYHFIIEQVEEEIEVIAGRLMDENGAHCLGMNSKSLGVCMVGNFDKAPPSEVLWTKSVEWVASLCRTFNIPYEDIRGHRDFSTKTCPGMMFDLDKFREDVRALL